MVRKEVILEDPKGNKKEKFMRNSKLKQWLNRNVSWNSFSLEDCYHGREMNDPALTRLL